MRLLCASVIITTMLITLRKTAFNRKKIFKLIQLNKTFARIFKLTFNKRFLLNSSLTIIKNRKIK